MHIIELRFLSPVSRVPCFLLPYEGLAPLAMDMSPTDVGYKFRSPAARQIPICPSPPVRITHQSLIAASISMEPYAWYHRSLFYLCDQEFSPGSKKNPGDSFSFMLDLTPAMR